jgi:O-antigen ligase
MSVLIKINQKVNQEKFFPLLIALILSTLFIGYAPSSIAIGVYAFFVIWKFITNKQKNEFQLAIIFPILLYLLFVITLLWSVDVDNTIKGLERTITLLFVPLLFLIKPKFTKEQTKCVLEYYTKANFLYGVIFLLFALFNFFKTKSITVFTYHELVQVFDLNAIYVSVYYLISLGYLLSKKQKSIFDKISIIFFIVLILLLSSKMAFLALFIIMLSYGVFITNFNYLFKRKIIFASLLGLLLASFVSLQVVKRFIDEKTTNIEEVLIKEKFNKTYPWTGTSIRLLQLRILSDQLEEDSIFWKGFGLFASRENLKKRHLGLNTYYGYHTYNYHNQYAQVLSETGIFGLFLLILMLANNIYKAIKTKNFLFYTFALIMPLIFFTESFLWVHKGLIFFILMYCLLNTTEYSETRKRVE